MRQIPGSFYVISKEKKKKGWLVAICPRAADRSRRRTRKIAQRLIAARSLRAQESSICGSFHLITSRPAAGKVDQGAAGCVEPGSGREFGSSLATGAGTGSLPLAPRGRQTCASLPHRVTHRCPWIARQKKKKKHALRAEKMEIHAHSRAVEKKAGGAGRRRTRDKRKFGFNEADQSPPGGSAGLLLRF